MIDGIDPGPSGVLYAASAVGMGGNLEAQAVRGAGDGADFSRVEVAFEPAALLAEHAERPVYLTLRRMTAKPVSYFSPGSPLW